ncbi:transketolase [Streptococcus iniae]|uniref:Transketolase n=2 Tax=Streptococcus iniae TaxID=1346 RepID=A0A1J0N0S8_STRIN|nr:transketolase [Streptococcus iniae]AGM99441.1 transketolase [Streptococcus iniae SF1]AHY16369.1 transketolase [Streptococcus iniae]AHY18232.1 transketolase [Streptococcus iniae]AJG26517.1 transketolase [Streptococcus iniae]APD32392.1 transketolase [Streptococcus iniae]
MTFDAVDQLAVNTVRTLSMDAIQAANSGHPGLPMGAAPMAYVLWNKFMNVNPKTSRNWTNRDRFVLSAGHGSAMLYSLLHLAGYDLSIDDLKNFRQWGSKTPGHPEVNHTDGVEATSGPLGQGIANALGFAMAEAHLAAKYNKPGFDIVDHYTYAINGDGDLMEGVSQEAASLAGHLKLGKLVLLYDSNDISLDGPTSMAFTEDVKGRFEAYGWQHILVKDGNDLEAIAKAIEEAKAETQKPTIIEVKTIIGFGAEKQGTSAVHGAPLGADGIAFAKQSYGWTEQDFTVPAAVEKRFADGLQARGQEAENAWNDLFAKYEEEYPELAKDYKEAFANQAVSVDLEAHELGTSKASRVSSQEAIQQISAQVSSFWGGSADLSASNNTMVKVEKDFQPGQFEGRNIWFGVREFAMAAAMNGIALHGGTRVYGGTFFVFSNYLLPAVRMAALQNLPTMYVMTHDSIAVGEDGPTHEPIEQLASVRSMPNLNVIRPADGNETNAAWKRAMAETDRPTMLVLTRQNLPVLEGTKELAADGINKGAYILSEAKGDLDGIIIATGSEVKLAMDTQAALEAEGIFVRVVSMPSQNIFDEQSAEYKEEVLPKAVTKRLAIEAASSFGWAKYVGLQGQTLTIDTWGASAPGNLIFEEYGFTTENAVNRYKSL